MNNQKLNFENNVIYNSILSFSKKKNPQNVLAKDIIGRNGRSHGQNDALFMDRKAHHFHKPILSNLTSRPRSLVLTGFYRKCQAGHGDTFNSSTRWQRKAEL